MNILNKKGWMGWPVYTPLFLCFPPAQTKQLFPPIRGQLQICLMPGLPAELYRIKRERHRYLCNEAGNQQLFCLISPAIYLLHSIWVMSNKTTKWQDICDKKQLYFGFTPKAPPVSRDTYSFLYLLYISVVLLHFLISL